MKKIIIAIAIALLSNFLGIAQEIALGNYEIYITYLKGEYRKTAVPEQILGSPYMDNNFRLGALSFEGSDPVTVPMRYNIVNEEFEVRIEDKIYYVQDEVEVRLVEGIFKKYNYRNDKNNIQLGYFKTLFSGSEDGKLVLLEKFIKRRIEAQEAAPMKPRTPAKYVDRSELYLKFPDSKIAVRAENKPKHFIEVFPIEHQEKIKDFIKTNRFKTDKEQDLQSIINYYNNIVN